MPLTLKDDLDEALLGRALALWAGLSDEATELNALEKQHRLAAVYAAIDNYEQQKGSKTYTAQDGEKYTFTLKHYINFDETGVGAVQAALGSDVTEKLFKVKVELSLTEYNKLTDEQRAVVDPFVTTKPALPSIKKVS